MMMGIASLVAMIAGAYMQNKAQTDAADRQQQTIRESLQRQQALQRNAEDTAMKKALDFAPETRHEKQAQLEQQLTQELIAPVQQAAVAQEAPSVQGDVSEDYTTAKAKSQAEQMKSAESLARIFGRIGSASQLRQNEAIGLGDTANQIGMLSSFSQGQRLADQVGIHAAGVPDGGAMLAGTVLQGAGSAGMSGAFDGLKTAGMGNVWSGAAPVAQTGNIGLTGAGKTGFSGLGRTGLGR